MNHSTRILRHCTAVLALHFCTLGCAISAEEPLSSRGGHDGIEAVAPAAIPFQNMSTAPEGKNDLTVSTADDPLEGEARIGAQALTQAECDAQHIECFRTCWIAKPPWPLKKGDAGHYKYCTSKCLAEYVACPTKAGLLRTFDSLKTATAWLAQHPEIVAGTVVMVAGTAFVVSTGGAGALILLPLAA
jgi:hypothetical protein